MPELNEVVEKLNSNFDQFKKANDLRLAEIEKKGVADPLLTEKVEKLNKEIAILDGMKGQILDLEKLAARKSFGSGDEAGEKLEKAASKFAAMVGQRRGIPSDEKFDAAAMKEYKAGFAEMMRKGDHVSLDAQKALSVGSDPDGGYMVDPDMGGRIITQLYDTSPMRQFASQQTIGTDSLEGTHDLDEAGAGWVGETAARPSTGTPQIKKWSIPVHELYANPAATQKLLDDASVNLEAWLSGKVADKFARVENNAFVNGDGVGKPRGFLTYAAGTTLPGQIEQVNSGANGGFKTDGTGADVLVDVIQKLKQGYRSGASFFMPRTLVGEVRKLKDSQGRYLWAPGMDAAAPSTLMGYGIGEFEDMPQLATGSLSIAFGDMRETYQIVDRAGIRVLRDPYTNKPFIHFYTVKRVGGDVVNFEALKLIKFAA